MAVRLTRDEVAKIIDDFIEGRSAAWDWDDFICVEIKDPGLERIRLLAAEVPEGAYGTDEGKAELRRLADTLRSNLHRT
jgi:hypothetical protein